MNRTLEAVPPARLGTVWPRLRARFAKVETPDGWIVEDVYAAIKTSSATLFLILDGGLEVGVLVLRLVADYDGPRLHIWILQSDADFDVMTEFSAVLDDLGRRANAGRITFSSTRSGWARVAPQHGFVLREAIYQRVIP
jgi:hypothetical protein